MKIVTPDVTVLKIGDLKPAPYNPRRIRTEQFENLKKSLTEIGCIVPVLVNRANRVIIAGHQRTKAMTAVGMTDVPVFYVENINAGDEMKFNQLHNGTEIQAAHHSLCAIQAGDPVESFITLPSCRFTIADTSASAVKEICALLMKYGNVLSCVVCAGKVYLGHAYVKACHLLRLPVNTYIAAPEKAERIAYYFGKDYGEYCYDTIERRTYIQGLAQMHRSIESTNGERIKRSRLYVELVLPWLAKHPDKERSILDFGCGKAVYINNLKKNGWHNALGLEFFNHNTVSILVGKGNAMIDHVIRHVTYKGLFDDVICDSVLNSVDSMEAEISVLRSLSTFWSGNGGMFVSGRTIDSAEKLQKLKKSKCHKQLIYFLDENGFTADYRKGSWFFQHYHSRESLDKSLAAAGLKIAEYDRDNMGWRCRCERIRELTPAEKRAGIEFEFNLPLPNGKRYNRHGDMLAALEKAGAL